jgi:hypothetical protein
MEQDTAEQMHLTGMEAAIHTIVSIQGMHVAGPRDIITTCCDSLVDWADGFLRRSFVAPSLGIIERA